MKKKSLILGAVVAALLTLAFFYGWSSLDIYVPSQAIELKGEFRSMAEHDELMRKRDWPYVFRLGQEASGLLY